jgi:hypothetical protein
VLLLMAAASVLHPLHFLRWAHLALLLLLNAIQLWLLMAQRVELLSSSSWELQTLWQLCWVHQ